jgi:hypothetical protein
MSLQASRTILPPGQEHDPDPSFAEAAEALASLAASPVRPVGASVAVAVNKRNTSFATTNKPPRKRAKQGDVRKNHHKGRGSGSALPAVPKSSLKQSPPKKKKSPPSPHAPHAASAIVKADPLALAAAGAPDPSLLLAALTDNQSLDGPSRLTLQREVADIRMRYNSSGDLETLLREARDVDARLKRIGVQVKREDLLSEPNVSQLPADHPLLPTLLAIMAQGQGQAPNAAAAAASAAMAAPVPPLTFSFDDPKLAVALLAQQHARSQGIGASSVAASLPPLSQLNDQQLLLLRQLQLRQEQEEKVGYPDRAEHVSFGAQDGQQAELLRMLLLHKLQQQQQQQDESAIERRPFFDQLAPLLQQASHFSLPAENQQSSGLEHLLQLLRHAAGFPEASDNGAFPFLGNLGSAGVGQQHHFDALGRPHDVAQHGRDLELAVGGQEREQLFLRLARQAQQQQLHQESSRSPAMDAASTLPGLAGEQLPLLNLMRAQLILKQQAQQQASSEQERVVSILQALQESKPQAPFNGGLSEQEQLLGLLLKAKNQEQQSPFHDLTAFQDQQQIGSAAFLQLAQLQASLQQKAREEEEAAAAAAIHSSLSQGLAQLINNSMSLGVGASESNNAYPQHQVQLLAMLSALQQQQQQQQ